MHIMAYLQPKRNIDLASCMATDAYKHVRYNVMDTTTLQRKIIKRDFNGNTTLTYQSPTIALWAVFQRPLK